jgi:hypothetical protein
LTLQKNDGCKNGNVRVMVIIQLNTVKIILMIFLVLYLNRLISYLIL